MTDEAEYDDLMPDSSWWDDWLIYYGASILCVAISMGLGQLGNFVGGGVETATYALRYPVLAIGIYCILKSLKGMFRELNDYGF